MSSWANIAANTGSSSKHHTSNAAPFKIRRETSSAKASPERSEEVAVETLASMPKIDRIPSGKSPKLKGKQYVSLKNRVKGKSPAREEKKKGNLFSVLNDGDVSSSSSSEEDSTSQEKNSTND